MVTQSIGTINKATKWRRIDAFGILCDKLLDFDDDNGNYNNNNKTNNVYCLFFFTIESENNNYTREEFETELRQLI